MGKEPLMNTYGSIHIIGIGPGGEEHLTFRAKDVILDSDVIIGYKTYIDLLSNLIKEKEIFSTGMTREVARCQKAIEFAQGGKKVAVISSGDSGIYGMAGLILELLEGRKLPVSVIPGVPAFCAAGALLGAPLMNDFAAISLSDILTPWDVIRKRLDAAAQGDFVIILYNPKSKKRVSQLHEAIEIIAKFRKGDTPVGIVKGAARKDEEVRISLLKDAALHYDFIDMTTILIIGNSATYLSDGRMITSRGYPIPSSSKGPTC